MRMPKLLAAMALGACLLSSGAWGQNATDARLEALEQRIQQLEERLAERDAAMMEKEQALAKLQAKVAVQEQTAADIRARVEESGGGWTDGLEIGGAIEVLVAHDSPYVDKSTSDNTLDTVDVAFTAEISDSASAELVLTKDDDSKIEVDTAAFTVGMEESPVSFTAGQFTLPFADFGTELVSDPMALEIGEVGETALQIAVETGGLSASVYAYNGDVDYKGDHRINNFGVQADYEIEIGGMSVNLGAGWLNDLRTADAYESDEEDWPPEGAKKVAGLAVAGGIGIGPVSFSGHYMSARDKFDELDVAAGELPDAFEDTSLTVADYEYASDLAQPSAYGIEMGYAFSLGGKDAVFAIGWQRTREALALDMPESRTLVGFSTELVEGVGIAVEYARHGDYDAKNCSAVHSTDPTTNPDQSFACGGTGKNGSTVTLQLAAEF